MAAHGKHKHDYPPSDWVKQFAKRIPAGGTVLDVACGAGRHGRMFLDLGHAVTFIDADTTRLADLAGHPDAEIIETDLESGNAWPLGERQFMGVIVTNYLWRPILPQIITAVATGGILIYETFTDGNEAYGRPRNPDFLLRSGELLEVVRGRLHVIAYGQCIQENKRVVQHITAERRT